MNWDWDWFWGNNFGAKKVRVVPKKVPNDLIQNILNQLEDHRADFVFFSNLLKEFRKTTTKSVVIQQLEIIVGHEQSHFQILRQILYSLTGRWANDLDTTFVQTRLEGTLSENLITGFEGEMQDAQNLQVIFGQLGNSEQKDLILSILVDEQENAMRLVYAYSWWNCGQVPTPRPQHGEA